MLILMVREGKVVSRYAKQGTKKEKLWEHGNTGQFWKGTGTSLGEPRKWKRSRVVRCQTKQSIINLETMVEVFNNTMHWPISFNYAKQRKTDDRRLSWLSIGLECGRSRDQTNTNTPGL